MDILESSLGDRALRQEVAVLRKKLITHPLYLRLNTLDDLRIYMTHHVFAVWDFMSLLKRLQKDLTQVAVPWLPRPRPEFTRFINEIVLDEESDQDGQGGILSHFELYLSAMEEVGANRDPIHHFLSQIEEHIPVSEALESLSISKSTTSFVQQTLAFATKGATHEVAAAFFYGREDIIPDMFRKMAEDPAAEAISKQFVYYLRRHIELDGDQHGPLAEKLLALLCGSDATLWNEALQSARLALAARISLWDGIVFLMDHP